MSSSSSFDAFLFLSHTHFDQCRYWYYRLFFLLLFVSKCESFNLLIFFWSRHCCWLVDWLSWRIAIEKEKDLYVWWWLMAWWSYIEEIEDCLPCIYICVMSMNDGFFSSCFFVDCPVLLLLLYYFLLWKFMMQKPMTYTHSHIKRNIGFF